MGAELKDAPLLDQAVEQGLGAGVDVAAGRLVGWLVLVVGASWWSGGVRGGNKGGSPRAQHRRREVGDVFTEDGRWE